MDVRSEAQRLELGLVPGAWFVPRDVLEWRAEPACEYHDPRLVAVGGPLRRGVSPSRARSSHAGSPI